jgi:hypothetical protein
MIHEDKIQQDGLPKITYIFPQRKRDIRELEVVKNFIITSEPPNKIQSTQFLRRRRR